MGGLPLKETLRSLPLSLSLLYCELFAMMLCLPIGSEGRDIPSLKLIIMLQIQKANSQVNRTKQYEVVWACLLWSVKAFPIYLSC